MSRKHLWAVLLVTMVSPAWLFGAGTVSGKVTYTGTPAKQKTIDMSKEPSCAKQHTTPITTETVVAGFNNTLGNVVGYISSGAPVETREPPHTPKLTQKGDQDIPPSID